MDDYVQMPSGARQHTVRQRFFEVAEFPDVVGCIDGTHFKIKAPSAYQNAFVNRKGYHSINAQIVCDHELKMTNCVIKWPGSKHDSFILRQSNLWAAFEEGTITGMLLADSGYPLRKWLMTPLLNPANDAEDRYNNAHIKTRNAVERCIGVLKRRWACLQKGITMEPDRAAVVAGACVVLHNLTIQWKVPYEEPAVEGQEENQLIPENHRSPAGATVQS
ncbi:hypothetical protein SKAU_G00236070 [Synaphobranchus kaupii]|uniref:Putative nuclease HARBI1 n=1 Tax=Synaphobranchus kaupii TaxID=118154 RepID=A0A9Q1F708_SYNKA|nr:hypothetical protein SKAU_G00236070 [Synaphobranchus kaupii]